MSQLLPVGGVPSMPRVKDGEGGLTLGGTLQAGLQAVRLLTRFFSWRFPEQQWEPSEVPPGGISPLRLVVPLGLRAEDSGWYSYPAS